MAIFVGRIIAIVYSSSVNHPCECWAVIQSVIDVTLAIVASSTASYTPTIIVSRSNSRDTVGSVRSDLGAPLSEFINFSF